MAAIVKPCMARLATAANPHTAVKAIYALLTITLRFKKKQGDSSLKSILKDSMLQKPEASNLTVLIPLMYDKILMMVKAIDCLEFPTGIPFDTLCVLIASSTGRIVVSYRMTDKSDEHRRLTPVVAKRRMF